MREIQAAIISLTLAAISIVGVAAPVYAVDGVTEINQASVNTVGNTLHRISAPGSYRLTNDLIVPDGFVGIGITVSDVTLDLNGFSIVAAGQTTPFRDGIQAGAESNIEIRNGSVKGFSRHGVFSAGASSFLRVVDVRALNNVLTGIELQGTGMLIRGCLAANNGSGGIRGGDNSLATGNISRDNTGTGLILGAGSGYGENVLANNGTQVAGGLAIACNFIDGTGVVCP